MPTIKSQYNQYDIFIICSITLLIIGSVQYSFIGYQFILAIMSFPLLVLEMHDIAQKKRISHITLFMLIWIIYAYISIIWAQQGQYIIRNLWQLTLCIIIFIGVYRAAQNANAPIDSILVGWTTLVLITLCIAFWEILTDSHIPHYGDFNALEQGGIGTLSHRIYAAVTYGNLNSYNTLLCMAFPFLCFGVFKLQKKVPVVLAIVGSIIVLIVNSSRGALLALAINIIVFLYYYWKQPFQHKRLITFFLVIIGTLITIKYGSLIAFQAVNRFESYGIHHILEEEEGGRWDLWRTGIESCIKSFGIGTGVGSTQTIYEQAGFTILFSHNFVIEFIIQYGIWLFIPLGLQLVNGWYSLIRSNNNITKMLGWMLLLSFIPTVIIDDSYIAHSFFWLWLCSQFVVYREYAIDKSYTYKISL